MTKKKMLYQAKRKCCPYLPSNTGEVRVKSELESSCSGSVRRCWFVWPVGSVWAGGGWQHVLHVLCLYTSCALCLVDSGCTYAHGKSQGLANLIECYKRGLRWLDNHEVQAWRSCKLARRQAGACWAFGALTPPTVSSGWGVTYLHVGQKYACVDSKKTPTVPLPPTPIKKSSCLQKAQNILRVGQRSMTDLHTAVILAGLLLTTAIKVRRLVNTITVAHILNMCTYNNCTLTKA